MHNAEPGDAADPEPGPLDIDPKDDHPVHDKTSQGMRTGGVGSPSDLAGLRRRSCTLEEFARQHRYPVGAVTCATGGGVIVFAAAVDIAGQIQRYEETVADGLGSPDGPADVLALRRLLDRIAIDARTAGAPAEVWVASRAARKLLRLRGCSGDHGESDNGREWVHIHAKPVFTSAKHLAEDAAARGQELVDRRTVGHSAARGRKRRQPAGPVEVATDASIALRRRRAAAIAYVSEFGDWSSRIIRTSDTCLAELAAVEFAISRTPSTRALRIRTDSQFVAGLLNDPARLVSPRYRKVRMKITAAMKTRQIQVVWVRGHAGDRLNDAADRIAVLTRRAHEGGFDARAIGDRIAAEAASQARSSTRTAA